MTIKVNATKNMTSAGIVPVTPVVIGSASMPAPIEVPAVNKVQPKTL